MAKQQAAGGGAAPGDEAESGGEQKADEDVIDADFTVKDNK